MCQFFSFIGLATGFFPRSLEKNIKKTMGVFKEIGFLPVG